MSYQSHSPLFDNVWWNVQIVTGIKFGWQLSVATRYPLFGRMNEANLADCPLLA
jgi:hypothetical protein